MTKNDSSSNSKEPQQDVIGRLAEMIASKRLSPGDCLPSVRDLAQQWGIGRNLVRDGLVRAQMVGLVEIRPRSGVTVRAVDYAPLVETLSQTLLTNLRQQDPNLVHLWEARAIIEAHTAANAALRRLPEDLHELSNLLEQMRKLRSDRPKFVEADETFHLGVARIAGNPVLSILLNALLKILRPDRLKTLPTPAVMQKTAATHETIFQAILEGNAEKAGQVMAEHCKQRIRYLLEPHHPA